MALLAEAERILVHDEFPIMPMYVYVTSDMVKPDGQRLLQRARRAATARSAPICASIHPLRDVSIRARCQGESAAR